MMCFPKKKVVSRSDHSAMLTGTFTTAMSGAPFMVLRGDFQLFNKDVRTPDTKNLTYDFDMVGTDGQIVHFNGYKIVNDSAAFSPLTVWRSTSTLYVTLTRPDKSVLGRGVLLINPVDFASELLSFKATGEKPSGKLESAFRFFSYFTKQVSMV